MVMVCKKKKGLFLLVLSGPIFVANGMKEKEQGQNFDL